MRALERALGHLARFMGVLSALALASIVVVIVASVVMRRVAGAPLYYSEDLVGLLLSASLFLALPLVTLQAEHVRVTFLLQALPPRGRIVLAWLAGAVTLGFCGWFLLEAIPWLQFALQRNIRTETASLRLAPWMAVLPWSIAVTGLLVMVRLLSGTESRTASSLSPDPAGQAH